MPEQRTAVASEEILETYNHMHGTAHPTPQAMVEALYKQEKTLARVGTILGYDRNTINVYMKRWGLPRLPKGHRGNTSFQVGYRGIDNPEQYTHKQIAEKIGCTEGHVYTLRKSIAMWKKRSQNVK